MNGLFSRDMDLPLQTIFLELDPPSLKNSRLVCGRWNDFIKRRVWGGKKDGKANSKLKKRLAYHWIHADPTVKSVELQLDIFYPEREPGYVWSYERIREIRCPVQSLSCDDSMVVCGLVDDTAKVYDIQTLALLKDLDCCPLLPHQPEHGLNYGGVRSDVGQDVVATVTDKGDVSVWKKSDWSLLYKQSPHGNVKVNEVKVLPDLIITAGDNGRLSLLSWDGEMFSLRRMIGEGLRPPWDELQNMLHCGIRGIHGLDSDGEWVLFASMAVGLQLWSLTDDVVGPSISIDTQTIISVALSYPYGVIFGHFMNGPNVRVVQVWDLVTGQLVRNVNADTVYRTGYNNSIMVGTKALWTPEPTQHGIQFFNLQQITSPKLETPLWRRRKYLEDGDQLVVSSVNTSCLVAVQGDRLHVWNFWNCDKFSDNPDTT